MKVKPATKSVKYIRIDQFFLTPSLASPARLGTSLVRFDAPDPHNRHLSLANKVER
jgi:hypothetical protein